MRGCPRPSMRKAKIGHPNYCTFWSHEVWKDFLMNLRVPSCHDMIITQGSGAASADSILDSLKARGEIEEMGTVGE